MESVIPIFILTGIGISLGLFYLKVDKTDRSIFRKIDILLILLCIIGAIATYWLNIEYGISTVLAAGIVGFLSSFLPLINRKSDILRELPVAIYCGSFVGMTAPLIAQGYFFIISAGLLSGTILIFSKNTLHGYGGKLGTIAFGGVSLVSLFLFLFS